MSVALSTIVEIRLFSETFVGTSDILSKRPVPRETTQWKFSLGQSSLLSWMAKAVGLLVRRPPSCVTSTDIQLFFSERCFLFKAFNELNLKLYNKKPTLKELVKSMVLQDFEENQN